MDHGHLTRTSGVHTSVVFVYTNAADRLGDSSLTTADFGKFAIQTDDWSIWLWSGTFWVNASGSLLQVPVDISLTTSASTVIDTRPATPAGINRWKLVSIDLRLKTVLSGGTAPTATISIGTAAAGTQIVLPKLIDDTVVAGTIVGGFQLSSLGADMSQSTGFQSTYPAGQAIYANVAVTGAPTGGVATAYLLWQGFS